MFSFHLPLSGLRYHAVYLWREAARWAGYKWTEFSELDGDEQSAIIAHYSTHKQIEAVLEHDRIQRQKAAERRNRSKR